MRVPITRPFFDEEDFAAISKPLETGWVVQGPNVAEFERLFAEYTGAAHAVACTSCTTGLHMGLAALGVGPGDEVVVPAFTWVASANAVLYCGATPVFCDVSLDTFNLDPEDLAGRITPRTKALLPVHLFGLPVDMGAVSALAKQHDLGVLEDAACGLGARYQGTHVGHIGDYGAFSFHPRKAITTGEGGMVTSNHDAGAALLRSLRDHGSAKSDLARHKGKAAFLLSTFDVLGFNYRMTDFQGALGVAQMGKVERIQSSRARLAARYDHLLAGIDWLQPPTVPEGDTHGYQSYVCLYRPEAASLANVEALYDRRNALMMKLEELGVSTRQGTHAVHALGLYRERFGLQPEDFPGAWMAEQLSLALPLFPTMTDEEQDYVVQLLKAHGPWGSKPQVSAGPRRKSKIFDQQS